jgi:hypothetical protein
LSHHELDQAAIEDLRNRAKNIISAARPLPQLTEAFVAAVNDYFGALDEHREPPDIRLVVAELEASAGAVATGAQLLQVALQEQSPE